MTSVGLGSVISTINLMMCRGVRNCPFTPAEASFDSRYSYRSPLVSRFSRGTSSSIPTTLDSSAGVGMVKLASLRCSAYVDPSPPICVPSRRRKGKTALLTVVNMRSGS